METVIIIGAGASGMMAALSAAEERGYHIRIIERQQRAAKKLLATGNGRCNLTNTGAGIANYHGEDPGFASFALENFPPSAVIEYFKNLGLLTRELHGGRVYPLSDSANSAADVLRYACESRGVEFICSQQVTSVKKSGRFSLKTQESQYSADYVIVACGGMAGATLGGVKDGYELLCALGHSKTSLYPALCPINCESIYTRGLKGVRCDAELSLYMDRRMLGQSRGELQFTETGVSGPVSFDLSSALASSGDGKKELRIDFLRDYPESEIYELLCKRREQMPHLPASELLVGMLHNRLARTMAKHVGIMAGIACADVGELELRSLARDVKRFVLPVKGLAGFDAAQVTRGGIRCADFNPRTMESRLVPGLFACGELLDIDGDCGGYNLQWAWASGRLAGRLGR